MSRRDSAEATAEQITDLAAKRRAEALSITGSSKRAVKAKRPAAAKAAAPKDSTKYVNFRIRKSQYRLLWQEARAREVADDHDSQFDMSGILRGVLDFYEANKEDVDEWVRRHSR